MGSVYIMMKHLFPRIKPTNSYLCSRSLCKSCLLSSNEFELLLFEYSSRTVKSSTGTHVEYTSRTVKSSTGTHVEYTSRTVKSSTGTHVEYTSRTVKSSTGTHVEYTSRTVKSSTGTHVGDDSSWSHCNHTVLRDCVLTFRLLSPQHHSPCRISINGSTVTIWSNGFAFLGCSSVLARKKKIIKEQW